MQSKTRIITIMVLNLLLNFIYLHSALIPIKLEHAMTEQQRAAGLMGRKFLNEDEGMLFHFPHSKILSFWMYNTYIDLSIAFLDEKGGIVEIRDMEAYPNIRDREFFLKRLVSSQFPARFALEVNKDWFKRHGIKPGDQLIWDLKASMAYINSGKV